MAGHVFISYSRGDAAYVSTLVGFLTSEGIPVWIDEALQPGTPTWVRVVEREIENCQAFLLVMSSNSSESSWVDRELDLAQELGKPILPLLLSGRRFMRIRDMQTEVVTDSAMPSNGFLSELRRLLGRPPTSQPRPTPEPPPTSQPPPTAEPQVADGRTSGVLLAGFSLEELFGPIGNPPSGRGRDVEADIALKPNEAVAGMVVPFTLRLPGGCEACQGKGEESCPDCHGDGAATRTMTVRIPPGVRDGQRIRLAGRGRPGSAGGEAGDLFLIARVS
jgi:hypothetical protein